MEFDALKTAAIFAAIVAAGTGALIAAPMMLTETVLTMVLPSMVIYGAIMLGLGIKHGQYRESESGLGMSL